MTFITEQCLYQNNYKMNCAIGMGCSFGFVEDRENI